MPWDVKGCKYTIHDSFAPKDAPNLQKFAQVAATYLLALVMCPLLLSQTVNKHKGKWFTASRLGGVWTLAVWQNMNVNNYNTRSNMLYAAKRSINKMWGIWEREHSLPVEVSRGLQRKVRLIHKGEVWVRKPKVGEDGVGGREEGTSRGRESGRWKRGSKCKCYWRTGFL